MRLKRTGWREQSIYDGLDLPAGAPEFRAEPADVHVDRSRLHNALVAPDPLQQAIARDHAILVLHQKAEQIELAPGESDLAPVHEHGHGVEIGKQMRAAIGQGQRFVTGPPPQHRPHARRQFAQAERLGHIIVGAVLEPGDALVFTGARGQHDDWHAPHLVARAQDPTHVDAAQDGQIQIENDQVGNPFGCHTQCGIAGADNLRLGVAAALERMLDEPGDILFVFDDENPVSRCQQGRD